MHGQRTQHVVHSDFHQNQWIYFWFQMRDWKNVIFNLIRKWDVRCYFNDLKKYNSASPIVPDFFIYGRPDIMVWSVFSRICSLRSKQRKLFIWILATFKFLSVRNEKVSCLSTSTIFIRKKLGYLIFTFLKSICTTDCFSRSTLG